MRDLGNNVWLGIMNMVYSIHSIDHIEDMCQLFLKQTRWLVPFDHAMFIFPSKEHDNAIEIPVYYNFDENYIRMYKDNYQRYDYAAGIKIGGNSIVFRDSDIIDENVWYNSSFYMQFCKPNHIKYIAHTILIYNNQFCGEFALYRDSNTINASDFKATDIFILNLIKEHLSLSIARIEGLYINNKHKPDERNKEPDSVRVSNEMEQNIKLCSIQYKLTTRETEILRLLTTGLSTSQICDQIMITLNTLKKHNLNIYKKLGVKSRIQLLQLLGNYTSET